MLEILKAILYGIVEGITEWLPISSTGHLILLKEIMPLSVSEEFWSMFEVVIQLGAIVAVLVLFFHKLNPFSPRKTGTEKRQTWDLWGHVVVAMLPAAVLVKPAFQSRCPHGQAPLAGRQFSGLPLPLSFCLSASCSLPVSLPSADRPPLPVRK